MFLDWLCPQRQVKWAARLQLLGALSGALAHIIKSRKIWQRFHIFVQHMGKKKQKGKQKKISVCLPSSFTM